MPTRNFVADNVGTRAVLVSGTFGAGGSITMQGSNDGTDWFALTDDANVALTFTAAGGDKANQNYRLVRPNVTAGDGTTNLTVRALLIGWRR